VVHLQHLSRFLDALALAALLLLPFVRSARAQVGQGEITGLVTDPSGASVPDAKVTLTSNATGESRDTLTTSTGIYRFVAVAVVGTYAIRVEASGFKTVEVAGIVVSTGTVITQDIHLEIGAASQTVLVKASAEHIDTTDSSVSTLVDRRLWQSLPLEARTQNTFINILPGVVPDQFAGTTRGAAVNGTRPGMSNYLIDGYDNNDQGQGGAGVSGLEGAPGAVTQLSPDAIQEYRVITNGFPAEYGKGGGFVNDTVLKSGTNDWHGSVFEYNRVQAFAANDFFSNAAGIKDRLVRNQFGGSAGGPIVKEKTFFYATYERQTRREASPIVTTGTTQDFINFVKSGAFETFMESSAAGFCVANFGPTKTCPGAFSHSATLGPNFTKLLSIGPFPLATKNLTRRAAGFITSPLSGLGFAQITYPVNVYGTVTVSDPVKLDQNKGSLKVDHRLSSKAQLSGTYAITDSFTKDAFRGSDAFIGPALLNPARSQDLGVTLTYTFTPVLIDQFRASYLRRLSNFPDAPGLQGIPSVVSAFDPLGVAFGDSFSLPRFFTDNQFQYQDGLTYVHGKHAFKAGGEYRRTRNGSSFQVFRNSLVAPWDVENLLTDGFFGDQGDLVRFGKPVLGGIAVAQASINPITNGFPEYYRGYRANEFAWYFQDDFRVAPRFAINAGLRWEYFGPPHNFRPGIDSNFYFGPPVTPISGTTISDPTVNPFFPSNSRLAAGVRTGTFQVRNHDIWDKDLHSFGPRFGFAWDLFGSQKFVLRGGYGIFYDRLYNTVFENLRFNPPFFAIASLGAPLNGVPAGPLATPGLYQVPFTSPAAFGGFGSAPMLLQMPKDLVNAYIQQFHLGTEWEFAHDFVLSVNGIGTIGNNLVGFIDPNTFDGRTACTTPRPVCVAALQAGKIPSTTFSQDRVNVSIADDHFRANAFRSNYYGLQIEGRKIFSNGLQFNANYTYSHAIDEFSDILNNGRGQLVFPADSTNIALDRGNADFDIRHRFVVSYYYELPFFKSNRWLGGWSWSGITTLQKGVPIQLIASEDTNQDGHGVDRPIYTGPGRISNAIQHSKSPADGYFNPSLFANFTCPPSVNLGLFCNSPLGRNTLIGPGFVNFDMGLAKSFKLKERLALQLQGNFFNIFNRPNFQNPDGRLVDAGGTFGKSTATYGDLGGHRITQLAVRLDF
jgi:hypothetical protein